MDVDVDGTFETGVILEGFGGGRELVTHQYTFDGVQGVTTDGWTLDVSLI